MYVIEKCTNNIAKAMYSKDQAHFWIQAWAGAKARFDCNTVDEAIATFKQRTSKVRTTPYRLRIVGEPITIAAINCLDVSRFQKYTISAVGFTSSESEHSDKEFQQSIGAVVPGSMGTIVGYSESVSSSVRGRIDEVAKRLSRAILSHNVTTRYNSSGRSGGAYLITSITSGILSNSDIGISCSQNTDGYELMVSSKFLASPDYGNKQCSFTGKLDHVSVHDDIDSALAQLKLVVRIATDDELAALLAA